MQHGQKLPSAPIIAQALDALRTVLFPGFYGDAELKPESMHFYIGATLDESLRLLRKQIQRALAFVGGGGPAATIDRAGELAHAFLVRLPEVRRLLGTDVQAHYDHDPAAGSPDEALFCYPGIRAITNYRIAHELYALGVPLVPRIIAEQAHSTTGIDIHPGAEIGERFFIDHGTGVVIGETSVIGRDVQIYQGVTLGARSFPVDEKGRAVRGIPRHPIVEDEVVIYAGATILGRITVGRGSMIGGNVWLTHSVPPGSRVLQASARQELFTSGEGI
ncbi:MAG: hypothetical protein KDA22_10045 [Phycisphaerales bacterium]|nr:hypothetical protein [Phycisphaerales bacterium]